MIARSGWTGEPGPGDPDRSNHLETACGRIGRVPGRTQWLTIADRSGRPEARKTLANLRAKMTPEEIEEARRRVQQFYTSTR